MMDPATCQHENVRTFHTIPPHTKCLDCGALVIMRWLQVMDPITLTEETEES